MHQSLLELASTEAKTQSAKKILFANIPADGHFNPLTALAVHLKDIGHDVRWYTGPSYAKKIEKLGIPYFLFQKAKEVTVHNIDEVFPERKAIKSQFKKVNFDICNYFILRAEEFFSDIEDINDEFDFDILIADCAFTGITLTRSLLNKEVIAVGVLPLQVSSKDLGPTIMGLPPFTSFAGKKLQQGLKWIVDNILLKKANEMMRSIHQRNGIDMGKTGILDAQLQASTLFLQSGSPSFEYKRSDLSEKIKFVGPLLPTRKHDSYELGFEEKIARFKKVILVTQGTFEKDSSKLIIPTLEAFKNSEHLVVVTTAGSNTKELREAYPQENIIIEDFIPFDAIMPYADVFVSNGGYGGVMYSISSELPMVAAGVHEGKNEICTRIGYFKLGINLKTENPSPNRLKLAVEQIFADGAYHKNVQKLAREFAQYDPAMLCEKYVEEMVPVA
jgi:MGT family glycosyltransferase